MKENQELKGDNIVNDDKLEKEVTEGQEKWCLYRRVEVISADDEVNTRIDPYDKAKLIKNLFKINMDIDTISEVTGLSKNRILDIKHVLNVVSKGRFERDVMEIKEECDLDYKKRISRKTIEFSDGMQAVSFALNTGYSIENSFAEALQELVMLYGQNAVIVADFNMIVNRIRRNENLEDILDDYAASTNLDDIKYFAEIFRYAKRSGGDVIGIIKQTSHIIHEKAEVQQQIDTIITGKRLEQRVMVCMPLVITLYLRLTSPEYIDVLYGNVMGIIVMTICLLIYAAAVMLSQKITDINI